MTTLPCQPLSLAVLYSLLSILCSSPSIRSAKNSNKVTLIPLALELPSPNVYFHLANNWEWGIRSAKKSQKVTLIPLASVLPSPFCILQNGEGPGVGHSFIIRFFLKDKSPVNKDGSPMVGHFRIPLPHQTARSPDPPIPRLPDTYLPDLLYSLISIILIMK